MEESQSRKWVEHFPPMPTQRQLTAVVCQKKALVLEVGESDWDNEISSSSDGHRHSDIVNSKQLTSPFMLQRQSVKVSSHLLSECSSPVSNYYGKDEVS